LLGREEEVREIKGLLLQPKPKVRLLTLTGPGGVGKSRLALQVAHELVESFPDGVHFVALAPIRDPVLVPTAIAHTLGLKESSNRTVFETLREYLSAKRLLLLLDNVEQLLRPNNKSESAGPMLVELLSCCPGVKALVTSREALCVRGEERIEVLPLAASSAVELFEERAQAVMDSELSREDAPVVSQVCVRLDGLPLAIELAAARMRVLSASEILARLDRRFSLLSAGPIDAPDRHRALHRTLDWSYDLLEPEEQRLFRRLGVFVGGCTIEAVQTTYGDSDVLGGLESLVAKSLLRQEMLAEGVRRFTMLETVREYALEMLEERGEVEAAKLAHAQYFLGLAEKAETELRGPQQLHWLDTLDREHDNLRAALAWATGKARRAAEAAVKAQHADLAVRLVSALGRFWQTRGYVTEGRQWLEAAIALTDWEQVDRLGPWHLNALGTAGVMSGMQGDYRQASAHTIRSLEIAQMRGDTSNMARAINILGIIARRQGNYALAEEYLTRCLQLYRTLDDKVSVAGVLINLGVVAHIMGKYEQALHFATESMVMRQEIGDKGGLALTLANLASMRREHGDFERARALMEEALALDQETGNKQRQMTAMAEMGQLLCDQGEYEEAESWLNRSMELSRSTGEQSQIGVLHTILGRVAFHRGSYRVARSLFREALTSHLQAHEYGADMVGLLEWVALLDAAQAASENSSEGYRQATLLLGATEKRRKEMGAPLPPIRRPDHDQVLNALRTQLEESGFSEAWAEGQAVTMEEAINLALEGTRQPAGFGD
jgi:predicted ATPase